MNLFEMEKHHTKTLWLLALLLTFSTVVNKIYTDMNSNISVTPNDQRTEGMKESRIINRKTLKN